MGIDMILPDGRTLTNPIGYLIGKIFGKKYGW
jgi:hypothetical protein